MAQEQKNSPPLNAGIDLDNPVTCTDCGRSYMCTPWDDYYGATGNKDGHCERCLLVRAGMGGARVVTMVAPPTVERPFPMGDPVVVHRSTGTIERDWEVSERLPDRVVVRKWYDLLGDYLLKHVPLETFNDWQKT